MNQLTKIFNGKHLRIIEKNNEPWFVAKDVCDILEIKNISQTINGQERIDKKGNRYVSGGLDEDEKATYTIPTQFGNKEVNVVNEFGLYQLVLKSRKQEAKQFKRWITHEVIPSIRKHGAYMTPEKIEEVLLNPDTIIKLATDLKEEREQKELEKQKRIQAEQTIELQKPKVIYADAVSVSKDTVLIKDLATVLRQKGIDIGTNRLFDWLRSNGYLCRQKGELWNTPTQRSLDLGIMVTKHGLRSGSDGEMKKTRTPKITGKGQIYFINKFLNQQEVI
ncbi:phage antirepressor KilAC domain-containing protein [Oceanobacillus sp. Castelsardo]|uniref:phage antirepressor n=1 Tax=Oceanobacillus sp. Castelsardo TaxID=1851204 RepID=UPI00083995C2|nr:phage antirepressor KilAC domain-containing protein [Oceanobacillus sp. Castelsardo]